MFSHQVLYVLSFYLMSLALLALKNCLKSIRTVSLVARNVASIVHGYINRIS